MRKLTNIFAAAAFAGVTTLAMSAPLLAQSNSVIWMDGGNTVQSGQRALLNENPTRAVKLIKKGLKSKLPDGMRVAGLSDLCIAYQQLGEPEAAKTACDDAIEADPKFWRAYNNRANISYSQEDYLGALQDYEVALALNPSAWQIQHNIDLIRTRYTTAN